MPVSFEHLAVPCRDAVRSARYLADLLGGLPVEADGPEGEFQRVGLGHGGFLLFSPVDGPFEPIHLAFQVDGETFAAIRARLDAAGQAYGNDPEGDFNGEVSDPLGGPGRLYFADPDGHYFEAVWV